MYGIRTDRGRRKVKRGMVGLIGSKAGGGHFLIVRAYDHCGASPLAPLAHTGMIMAIVAGWWFFGHLPDHWTFVGVAVLIVSAAYISMRGRALGVVTTPGFEQP